LSKKNISTIYFDGSFDCFNSIRKFIGDENLRVISLNRDPEESWIAITNDLCDLAIRSGETIVKDGNGKFKTKKRHAKRGYAGDV
jgi:hypothetical protein